MKLDALIFAAHPDDAELSMGGTIAKLTNNNIKVGIIDLTRGELGTRGTPETRKNEADEASKILNLTFRENLGFPDGGIKPNDDFRKVIIQKIREYQPSILFAPYINDRHPDHVQVSRLVKEAHFFSGVHKVMTESDGKKQTPFRADRLFYYAQSYEFEPSFIIDISDTFETKMKSVRAYKTQFFNPDAKEPETFISDPKFIGFLEARAKVLGFKIGKEFGEAFFSEEKIELDLVNLFNKKNNL